MEGSLPGPAPLPVNLDFKDNFEGNTLDLRWNFVRNPKLDHYRLERGAVVLMGDEEGLSLSCGHPTMIAMRQQAFNMETTVQLKGNIGLGQSSGLTAFYNSDYHYDILVTKEADGHFVCLRKRVADINVIVERHKIDYQNSIRLKIKSSAEWYSFFYEENGPFVKLGQGKTALLASEATHPATFTGTYFGIFSENGEISVTNFATKNIEQKSD